MKVIFLSQRVPYPPDRGDRITTHHFLQHLLDSGADVRVGCLAEEDQDETSIEVLRGSCREVCAPRINRSLRRWTCMRGLLSGAPLTTVFFGHRTLQETVDRWVAEDPPDLIYVYSSSMAQYALHHSIGFRFMQFAELDSDKWQQYIAHKWGPAAWIYRREAVRLLRFETLVARTFDTSAVVSPVEKTLFMEKIPDVTPVVLPNGVDVDHFQTRGEDRREPHTVIFTGVMDYEPNILAVIWFVEQCWPTIRAAVPDAKFMIVGSKPVRTVRRLDGSEGIHVTGRVPEIPPLMDRASVAVAPLQLCRGVQNKVLEAMSASLPVVASPQAVQGLGQPGEDILQIAESPADTAQSVVALLTDATGARRMGSNAARWVREHFRWENAFATFDSVIGIGSGS